MPPTTQADRNGVFNAVMEAHGHHHHLVIRPDDVWFAILVQFSFYVKTHAEGPRNLFFQHQGKKQLIVDYQVQTRQYIDFVHFASAITDMMEGNIVDADLRNWIMPCFGTITPNDLAVALVVMMGTL